MQKALLVAAALMLAVAPSYAQTVTQPFTFSVVSHDLPALKNGSVAWGDFDADGDQDAALSGLVDGSPFTAVYRNDGVEANRVQFVRVELSGPRLAYARASWADVDGDGDLDLLLTGSASVSPPYDAQTLLYRNDGATFVLMPNAGVPGLHSGSIDWADLDGDGDLDVLVTGEDGSGEPVTAIGRNDGTGTFDVQIDALVGIAYGDAALADFNSDGVWDVLLSGVSTDGFTTILFEGDASGAYSAVPVSLPALAFSSVDWGDVDGDGDLDFAISGARLSTDIFSGTSVLYTNNGGSFAASNDAFAGILGGEITFGDYDNDGDLDAFVYGAETALGSRTARIYRNDDGAFVLSGLLIGALFADAEWGDMDGDGDLDLITTGLASTGASFSNIYLNKRQVIPPLPSAPISLVADVQADNSIQLSWSTTHAYEGTFNIRIGTSPGADNVVPSMSDPVTGKRLVSRPGNVSALTFWTLKNLPRDTYYWSVQTVNQAFSASEFAAEGTFTTTGALATDTDEERTLPTVFAVSSTYPNPFSEQTTLMLDLPKVGAVRMRVWSVLGERVADVSFGLLEAGTHQLVWRPQQTTPNTLASGLYFFEISDGTSVETGSFTLLTD